MQVIGRLDKLEKLDTLENKPKLNIEVIYAKPKEQKLFCLSVDSETSVEMAIQKSGILDYYPEINLSINKVGIFSRSCQLSDPLYDNDRIEIYRPLIIDPKEARKQRALKNNV